MNLYDLTNEFLELANQLEEMELDEQLVKDTLDGATISLEEKAENIIKYAKNLQAAAEARENEAKRLTTLAKADLKKSQSLLNYLDQNLKMLNKSKLTAGIFEVKYRKGLEVVEVDEVKLPKQYFVPQPPKPMGKTELKKLVKEGQTIEGVTLVRKPDTLVVK